MGWAEALVLVLLAGVLVVLGLLFRRLSAARPAHDTIPASDSTEVSSLRSQVAQLVEQRDHERDRAAELQARSRAERDRNQSERDRGQAERESLVDERRELHQLRTQLDERDRRLGDRELRLENESLALTEREQTLASALADAELARAEVDLAGARATAELARVAGLDPSAARAEVLAKVEHEARLEAATLSREIERQARHEADQQARRIIVTAIQRLASEQTAESVVTAIELPSEEMKGRVIGREGRNIRAFEQITGVNVLIDDTPEVVLLSSFDPVRREVARLTLEELVADGRIHPQRIEDAHERSERAIADRCQRAGEDALLDVGISDLDPALVPILGSLRYRTSYGQNVLKHLVECAHLAAMMASELGLDPTTAKRGAFLHDIGKALTHASEGSHALVGAELARNHGEHPDVVHAIEAHHNEVEPATVEALLVQAADAISGSRPAARRESLEAYVQRLERLEELALGHDGVERVFAMQAGREVRVMVLPETVDDAQAQVLAKQIAREISEGLTFPGQIRVTVVRESRATEIAH